MGLLDDAIREHLDLKRRHGADPAEIERAEREALGPVRRGPDPVEEVEPVASAAPYDSAQDPDATVLAESVEDLWAEDDAGWADEDDHPPLTFDAPPARPHDEPEPPPIDITPAPSAPAGEETAEYQVEEAPAPESEREDVLEETPEFLSETPDHDRLWFEQRPPRDFDFDG